MNRVICCCWLLHCFLPFSFERLMKESRRAVHAHRTTCPGSAEIKFPLVASLRRNLLDHFQIDGDVDVIANHDTAAVDVGVPFHAEVLTIDLRRRRCCLFSCALWDW